MKPILVLLAVAVVVPVMFLLAFVGGGRWSAPTQPAPELQDELRGLRQAIAALAAQVETLGRERAQPGMVMPAAERQSVGGDAELRERLEQLVALLERQSTDLRPAPAPAVTPMDGRTVQDLMARGPDQPALAEARAMPEIQRDLSFHGWTLQQVTARFGLPSKIAAPARGGGEGTRVFYLDDKDEGVIFWFVDGVVEKVIDTAD